ncbi:hypothetical protein [Halomicrobium urmianum]|uniref:hypothetical protein n=1 Tax=Halomicrobium urmianum TaxID=1586233 RepID=UPI001CD9EE56|nr:hypothetical protein [Halomicrobium urmianum]
MDLVVGLISTLPNVVSILGIIGATLIAGPFGLIGSLLEIAGANQLLYNQTEAGFWMIVFGAGLVTIGTPIPWGKVLKGLLDSGSRY